MVSVIVRNFPRFLALGIKVIVEYRVQSIGMEFPCHIQLLFCEMTLTSVIFKGRAQRGRGIASVQIDWSASEFVDALGDKPFPGTLNVMLDSVAEFYVEAVYSEGVHYFIPAELSGFGAVLIHRWHGAPLHIIELVGTRNIREYLCLKDGDALKIVVSRNYLKTITIGQRLFHLLLWYRRGSWFYAKNWYARSFVTKGICYYFGQQGNRLEWRQLCRVACDYFRGAFS
jgi:hypothetical protein